MFINLNKSISLYKMHSCNENLFLYLHEDCDGLRRSTNIMPTSSELFYNIYASIEDYTLLLNGDSIFNLREGETLSYSKQEADSKKCNWIVNKVIYHPNVKKIQV